MACLNTMCLFVKDDIFVSGYEQMINTTFYLEYNGCFFPDDQWTDFAYPVIDIWTETLLSYKNSITAKFELFFMDGSYKLSIQKHLNEMLVVRCINFRSTSTCELEFECSYLEFLDMLLIATNKFNRILREKEMHMGRFQSVFKQSVLQANRLREAIRSQKEASDI